MLSYNEFNIFESFDLLQKPQKLTPTETKKLLIKYLSNKYNDPLSVANKILDSFSDLKTFKYNENNQDYIVFFGKQYTQYYEIHFNNIEHVDNFLNLNVLKSSQKIIGFLFSIIYHYGLKNSLDISITSDEKNNRSEFYKRITDKLIKKHDLHYEVQINRNLLILKYKPDVSLLFTERVLCKGIN